MLQALSTAWLTMRPLGTTAHEIVHSPSSVSEQAAGRAGDVIENVSGRIVLGVVAIANYFGV